MSNEVEMITSIEIVVASQFPQAVPLLHQAAIVHELLIHASGDSTPEARILMTRTLANMSILSGLTLPQTAFAWLSHPEGIEGFMEDHGITHQLLLEAEERLSETLSALQEAVNMINEEAQNLQSMLIEIYNVSD